MMTSLDFYFDQATLERANDYRNTGNDWAMYQTLSDAVNAGGGDARLANGLKNAGDIHSAQRRDTPSIRAAMDQADHKVNKIKTQHHPAAV